jgi:hypothetical protein
MRIPNKWVGLNLEQRVFTHRVRPFFRILAISLAGLHTWAAITSQSMNADGIAYLDIGDAYFRGDWQEAINPVWSPMYSWVLGLVLFIFKPSMRMEFPLVQLTNYVIYLVALVSFVFFWRQLMHYRRVRLDSSPGSVSLPDWAMHSLGILLFIWASLTLIEIWSVTPDMLMAAIVFMAAAYLLRMRLVVLGLRQYAMFGLYLGLGFLAKTVMLPIAFLFLLAGLFSAGGLNRTAPRILLSLGVFILVAGPFIALISNAKGRFTFGESGQITYIRYVNGIPYPHWQGGPEGYGTPAHPSRQIFADPPVYEFAAPIGGTYPITYDPSYWYEGVIPSYSLGDLIPAILSNLQVYLDMLFREMGPFMAVALILLWLGFRSPSPGLKNMLSWNLAILAILTLGLYSLVYTESRYIGVFLVLIGADLLVNLILPDSHANRRLLHVASLVLVIFMMGNMVVHNLEGFDRLVSRSSVPTGVAVAAPPRWPGEVAEELHRLGITQGERVGVIGYAFDSYWARLARVKIVAEMFEWEADPFYLGDSEFQSKVVLAFKNAGASAIVAEYVPAYTSLPGWRQVGETNYHIYLIGDQ